jgi:hypothetical protein
MTESFNIAFLFTGAAPTIEPRAYDPDLHDVRSILSDICEALEATGRADFRIAGFGDAEWPLDVSTDLCVALEQVPHVIGRLFSGQPCELDLYEQGVQRTLAFKPNGSLTEVTCSSMTSWQPTPTSIEMRTEGLLIQLRRVTEDFCELVRSASPSLYHHPWFDDWRHGRWSCLPA